MATGKAEPSGIKLQLELSLKEAEQLKALVQNMFAGGETTELSDVRAAIWNALNLAGVEG